MKDKSNNEEHIPISKNPPTREFTNFVDLSVAALNWFLENPIGFPCAIIPTITSCDDILYIVISIDDKEFKDNKESVYHTVFLQDTIPSKETPNKPPVGRLIVDSKSNHGCVRYRDEHHHINLNEDSEDTKINAMIKKIKSIID